MLTYVLDKNGQPLMPTSRSGKVRRLLRDKKAKVIKRCPFTIRLLYETSNNIQPITLGVDAGSKHIGLSATTEKKVLFEAEIELRKDISELLAIRKEAREARRYRKTRYRAPRFENRISSKKEGWLAPSIKQKIDCHLKSIENAYDLLPISSIIIEIASFDIQKIKNSTIEGADYQSGDQLGFWNTREYVLFRDNHECQCCHGKSKDKILNVHHIESRKTGGNAPNNLITLCETCHNSYHNGLIELPKTVIRGTKHDDASFMNTMRWHIYYKMKEIYPVVSLTYGYKTKSVRMENNLPKQHYIDARCISNNPQAISDDSVYYFKKMRCHNRMIHRFKINKNNERLPAQSTYVTNGFRLGDRVEYKEKSGFVYRRRRDGRISIKQLDGTIIADGASYKKVVLKEKTKHYLCERRVAIAQ